MKWRVLIVPTLPVRALVIKLRRSPSPAHLVDLSELKEEVCVAAWPKSCRHAIVEKPSLGVILESYRLVAWKRCCSRRVLLEPNASAHWKKGKLHLQEPSWSLDTTYLFERGFIFFTCKNKGSYPTPMKEFAGAPPTKETSCSAPRVCPWSVGIATLLITVTRSRKSSPSPLQSRLLATVATKGRSKEQAVALKQSNCQDLSTKAP